ncbi:MAG TPA: M20/M25/M40 family metallo-hydrolase [Gemmatimonadaceae bacterium]|nr:M20/M25/M40 family metallo-hydrolase [Gemmatimonadaceae bacterium]
MRLHFSARWLVGLVAIALARPAVAQDLPDADSLAPLGRDVQSWIALRVSPGREAYATQQIREQWPDWQRGALGSLTLTRGSGLPRRVVACGIDEPSYVVSAITDDGYLRVHVAGARARNPQTDLFHVGQRIVVLTTDRADPTRVRIVPGVFGVRSTHLWRRAPGAADAPTTLEDLWIDIGARSDRDVAAMGVRVLDPVFRDAPDWSVGSAVVGPAAMDRASCAAVASAAQRTPANGTTTLVISTQSSFAWAGLRGVLARLGDTDHVYVATRDTLAPGTRISVPVQYAGLLTETVADDDLRALFRAVAQAAGVSEGTADRARLSAALRVAQPTDSLSRYAELLARLTDTYGVSGDEAPVRDVVRARLPAWARDMATTDSAGNLIVAFGPDRDTVVFVAHLDEVGFEVVRTQNGIATLRQLGGFYPTLFTGQVALLHRRSESSERAQGCRPTSGTALRGVFLPPDSASLRAREVRAWFGDQLASVSDAAGARVTGYKCATRLGATRFSARSIDDRLGTAAQILALESVNRTALDHKVIFVWTVGEETGLDGARVVAAAFGPTVRRVHAVDTYVSADSPLETGRFAVVRIGTGAVVRALDNSSVAPPDEIERVVRIARSAGIPLQVNTTNGGNDGSVFVPFGAVDVPVSWPLRYSHSPAEVIDLRDMRSLSRLIAALANAPVR